MRLHSKEGLGSTFTLFLPYKLSLDSKEETSSDDQVKIVLDNTRPEEIEIKYQLK